MWMEICSKLRLLGTLRELKIKDNEKELENRYRVDSGFSNFIEISY